MFISFLLFVKLHSETSIRVFDVRKQSAESDEPTLSLDLQPMIQLWNYTSKENWCVWISDFKYFYHFYKAFSPKISIICEISLYEYR